MDRAPIHVSSSDGYANLRSELSELVASYPPPFIYVHDPHTSRIATSTVVSTLSTLKTNGANIAFAHANAVACFTPRLLYDTALNALAGWSPDWEDGCANWTGPLEGTSQRFNESFDGFTHGVRAVYNELIAKHEDSAVNGKGKNKAAVERLPDLRLVLVIEDAECMKENMPDIIAPLTRLHELVSVWGHFNATVSGSAMWKYSVRDAFTNVLFLVTLRTVAFAAYQALLTLLNCLISVTGPYHDNTDLGGPLGTYSPFLWGIP